MDTRKKLDQTAQSLETKPVEQSITPKAPTNLSSTNSTGAHPAVDSAKTNSISSPSPSAPLVNKQATNDLIAPPPVAQQLNCDGRSNKEINPYVRGIFQPLVTGGVIGITFYPINLGITAIQGRPANTNVFQYFGSKIFPEQTANKTGTRYFWDAFKANSKHIGRGMSYSCAGSFTKSFFTCNGPMVQKRLEHNFDTMSGRDLQDPTMLPEQTPFQNFARNKWVFTGGVAGFMGASESLITSGTAARSTCAMLNTTKQLKLDINLPTYYDKVTFAPGLVTRTFKNGTSQFSFLTALHLAEVFKKYYPEGTYGPLATIMSAGMTGVVQGGVDSVYNNIYTQQMMKIKQVNPGQYKVPGMIPIVRVIVNDIGWRGFARGGITNMVAMPVIFGCASSINDSFNNPDAWIYNFANKVAALATKKYEDFNAFKKQASAQGMKLFGLWGNKPDKSETPQPPNVKPKEQQESINTPKNRK